MKKLSLLLIAFTVFPFSTSYSMDRNRNNGNNPNLVPAVIVGATVIGVGGYYYYNNYYNSAPAPQPSKPTILTEKKQNSPSKPTLMDAIKDVPKLTDIMREKHPDFDEVINRPSVVQVATAAALKTGINTPTPTAPLKQEPTKQPVQQSSDTQTQPSFLDTLSNSRPVKFVRENFETLRAKINKKRD